jgi:glycosyltransferase involved in cell wall biosynthesis
MTIHLVYPHRERISCPDAIGRNVGLYLRRAGHRVIHYLWDDAHRAHPGDDDVLLGHPHYIPWTVFRRSARMGRWRRVIAMFPFAHGQLRHSAFADNAVRYSDAMLAITGRYWFDSVSRSAYAHWRPKMRHLDLAIDRNDFPVIKRAFAPPGKRRFLYIGHAGTWKNPAYLSAIARAMPEAEVNWAGPRFGSRPISGVGELGGLDFGTAEARRIVAGHDFFLTVGLCDANPTTVLESMAWGLIPVCTPQSGYSGYASIPNVPLGDVAGAVAVLRRLQETPAAQLEEMRQANWQMLDTHFTWDRFGADVLNAVTCTDKFATGHESLGTRLRLLGASVIGPHSLLHPRLVGSYVYRGVTGRSRSDRRVLEPIGDARPSLT